MIGIIGGSGVERLMSGRFRPVQTPYGVADVFEGRGWKFVSRHGATHSIPPNRINYRANLYALKNCELIVGINAVGAITRFKPGDLGLATDFIGLFVDTPSFYDSVDGAETHCDASVYSEKVNKRIIRIANKRKITVKEGVVVGTSRGMRYETPAEIEAFRRLGANAISMTHSYEASLVAELGIDFASLCVFTNYAAGIKGRKLSQKEVYDMMERKAGEVKKIVDGILEEW
ncbi:MAG: MTAP family purine nucleoside phosphorylase [Candidatus Anstonellales archaeon]